MTKTTKGRTPRKAQGAERKAQAWDYSDPDACVTRVTGDLASGAMSVTDALDVDDQMGAALDKRTASVTFARLRIVGAACDAAYRLEHGTPAKDAKAPAKDEMIAAFRKAAPDATDRKDGGLRQAIRAHQCADPLETWAIWESADDAARATDPKAWERGVQGFLRFADAYHGGRVDKTTLHVYPSAQACKDAVAGGTVETMTQRDAAQRAKDAWTRYDAAVQAQADAKRKAAASSAMIGGRKNGVARATIAGLSPAARRDLRELLDSLDDPTQPDVARPSA